MAAPPVKSQPLHNFSLPTLKWAHKSSSSATGSGSRCRRRDSPDQPREPDSDNETQPPNRNQQSSAAVTSQNDPASAAADEGNGEAKPWNLRPRKESHAVKAAAKSKKEARAAECKEHRINSNNNGVKSQRIRSMVEGGQRNGGGAERNGSKRIWISLAKEEIEEDIYAMTGGKPSRRPRKWPRNVQKQLDNVFPGLYLVGFAADSYRAMMLWLKSERLRYIMNYANEDEDSD